MRREERRKKKEIAIAPIEQSKLLFLNFLELRLKTKKLFLPFSSFRFSIFNLQSSLLLFPFPTNPIWVNQ
jgi:hypothetical protein